MRRDRSPDKAQAGALVVSALQVALSAPLAARRHAAAQRARESRRVHISRLHPQVDVADIKRAFRALCDRLRREMIDAQAVSGQGCPLDAALTVDDVLDVNIAGRGGTQCFAFVELLMDDMATRLTVGDVEVEVGRPEWGPPSRSKCRRPERYMPLGLADPSRIVILGLPKLQVAGLQDTFETICRTKGTVTHIAPIPERGYYVEFADAAGAEQVVKELSGQVIGGHILVAQPASEPMRYWLASQGVPVNGLDEDAEARDPMQDLEAELLSLQVPLSQCLATFARSQPHLRGKWPVVMPTRVLVLLNLFEREELDEAPGAAESLRLDIEEEVERHGRVVQLIMTTRGPRVPEPPVRQPDPPRPQVLRITHGHGPAGVGFDEPEEEMQQRDAVAEWELERQRRDAEHNEALQAYYEAKAQWYMDDRHPVFGSAGIGRVYVEYETVDEAEHAQRQLAGRLFNGRTVITSFLFEDVLDPAASAPAPPVGADTDANARVPTSSGAVSGAATAAPSAAEPAVPQATDDID
jgi:hypothetical protein